MFSVGDFLNICYKVWNIFSCHFEEYCVMKVLIHFKVCISLIAIGANSFEKLIYEPFVWQAILLFIMQNRYLIYYIRYLI